VIIMGHNGTAAFKLSNPVHFLALGFGSGLIKTAPGTWGTLSAVPIYFAIAHTPLIQLPLFLSVIAVMFLIGCYLCGKTARDVGVHDHGAIVWDEIVGYLLTMAFVAPNLVNLIVGFVLFRFFDIIKPWPIKVLDRKVHGGFGIMIDDVLAAIFAGLILLFAQPYLAAL